MPEFGCREWSSERLKKMAKRHCRLGKNKSERKRPAIRKGAILQRLSLGAWSGAAWREEENRLRNDRFSLAIGRIACDCDSDRLKNCD